jgi:hypothetical protein
MAHHQRPVITDVTTFRATREDLENCLAIADAMRRFGLAEFPTRAAALRVALCATASHIRRTGRLPVGVA